MTQLEIIGTIAAIAVPTVIPTTAIVISILRSDAKIDALKTSVDAKIDAFKTSVDAKFDALSTRIDAKLDAKVDGLRNDIRADMRILDNIAYDHHGRLIRIEASPDEKAKP